jgi:hypothetical protein
VYLAICNFAFEGSSCIASRKRLAKVARCSVDKLDECIKHLETFKHPELNGKTLIRIQRNRLNDDGSLMPNQIVKVDIWKENGDLFRNKEKFKGSRQQRPGVAASSGQGSRQQRPKEEELKEEEYKETLSNASAREELKKEAHRVGTIPKREINEAPDGLPEINISAIQIDTLTKQVIESGFSFSEAKEIVKEVVTAYRLECGANQACHEKPYWAIQKWIQNEIKNKKPVKSRDFKKEKEPTSKGSWVCKPTTMEDVLNGKK